MYHYRKTRNAYRQHNNKDRKHDTCTFCRTIQDGGKDIESAKTMVVIANRVSYDVFEGRTVTEHLMIIPKRHLELLDDFSEEEAQEMFRLAAKYEKLGYNIYARGNGSVTRSVKHQHTHLIKTTNKASKLLFYIRRPYFLIKL